MINFEDIPDLYEKTARENASSFAKAKLVKDKLKAKLACITADLISNLNIPTSKAEALARASNEYSEYLKQAEEELYKAEIGRSELKSLEMQFDYCRSVNALEKARIKLI